MKRYTKRILSILLTALTLLSVGLAPAVSPTVQAASLKKQIAAVKRIRYTGFKTIKGSTYYFSKGKLAVGLKKIGGKKYYFAKSGKMAKKKLVTVKKNKYYFDKKGVMVTKKLVTVKGKKYYLTKTGKAKKNGFQKVKGKTYYFKSSGANKTGILNLKGKRYYFNKNGVLKSGFITIKGKRYYFVKNGKIYTGFKKISGHTYYITSAGYVQTGFKTISGKRYYFNGSGVMQTGLQMISGKTYYFNGSGVMQTGFVKINSISYYFGDDGVMRTGYTWVGDKLYFIETNGQIFQASNLKGWQAFANGDRQYYTENGVQLKSMVMTIGGKLYGFDANGNMERGFATHGTDRYYFHLSDGHALTGWQEIGEQTYHFGSNGVLDVNLFRVGEYLYYSDDTGALVNDHSGTIEIASVQYKQLENGAVAGIWFTDKNGDVYYFKDDGLMATGTVEIDGLKYYFESDGKLYGDNITRKGIDVSYHNGVLDWKKIKAAGVEFAMLRAGYGKESSQKDKQFEANYKNAKAVGMPVGAYTYSYAQSVKEAKQEAKVMKEWLKGKSFEYPIAFDIEDEAYQGKKKLTNKQRTDIVEAFVKEMEDAGYYVVVYANKNWLENYFDSRIQNYRIWLAQWTSKVTYKKSYEMWQYTSDGKLSGCGNTRFDMNYSYINYPALIRKLHLNNL